MNADQFETEWPANPDAAFLGQWAAKNDHLIPDPMSRSAVRAAYLLQRGREINVTKSKNLDALREMKDQGETFPSVDAGETPDLPEGFWDDAAKAEHRTKKGENDDL